MRSTKRLRASTQPALFLFALVAGGLSILPARAATGLAITEWMYNGTNGEFIEFTNFGPVSLNLSGWSFDDNSQIPGSENLSGFGIVAPGESVILAEADAATFRAEWKLSLSVKVIGGDTNNLSRNDEINLYDAANNLVDRLTFNDQGSGTVKGPQTSAVSGRPSSQAVIGGNINNASQWVLSSVGDVEGSFTSNSGNIGSPGKSSFAAAIPEPSAYAALVGGIGMLALGARRRR